MENEFTIHVSKVIVDCIYMLVLLHTFGSANQLATENVSSQHNFPCVPRVSENTATRTTVLFL